MWLRRLGSALLACLLVLLLGTSATAWASPEPSPSSPASASPSQASPSPSSSEPGTSPCPSASSSDTATVCVHVVGGQSTVVLSPLSVFAVALVPSLLLLLAVASVVLRHGRGFRG